MSTGGSFYDWDFGDGFTSNEVNPSHSYSNPGFYLTTLKVSYDSNQTCTSESLNIIEVFGLTSSSSLNQIDNFSISQNNGYIFVACQKNKLINNIKIYDSKGALIFNRNSIFSSHSKISIADFKTGIYIVLLNSSEKTYSSKILINN